jgi:hypothetical protein
MEKDYSKLFQNLEPVNTPEGLLGAVHLRIEKEQRRMARTRLAVFIPLAIVSCFAVAFSFQYLAQEVSRSGIGEYLSIIFSDTSTLFAYWKEFSLSIIESMPIWGTALFLGSIFVLLGSLKSVIKNTQITLKYA